MNGRTQPTLHPNALHFRGLLSTTELTWAMWWFELPHSYRSVPELTLSVVWIRVDHAPQGWAELTPRVLSREGLGGSCVMTTCEQDYTMTKKAPAWLLNKQNPTSLTGSTLWQLRRGSTAFFPGLASVISKHIFPLTHPGYVLDRYWKQLQKG